MGAAVGRAGCGGQAGAVSVEFALVLPLFLVLVIGVMEFGLIMFTKVVITNASREGARLGVIYSIPRKTTAEIQAQVQSYLAPANLAGATVTVTGAGGGAGSLLDVRVDYTYQFVVLPNLVSGLTGDLTLVGETVMRME